MEGSEVPASGSDADGEDVLEQTQSVSVEQDEFLQYP